MQTEKRLNLEDFKLTEMQCDNEIEKMFGSDEESSVACHVTSSPSDVPYIEFKDWE